MKRGWILLLPVLVFLFVARNPLFGATDLVVLEKEVVRQGEIFQVSVISSRVIERCSVRYRDNEVLLKTEGRRAKGFFGFDLAEKPGEKVLKVVISRGGTEVTEEKRVRVVDARFPVQRIDGVPDSYVNPDKKSLRRIMEEKKLLDSLWTSSSQDIFWSGNFIPPLEGFQGHGFGRRRVINGQPRSPHTGLDCTAPEGTPVRAVNRGVVRVARDLFFSGNSVVIDHGGGLFSMYFHLKEMFVKEGEVVEKGELIGTVGMTGRATGPHLHFGVRFVNERVDPTGLFR
ncbi:MAG: M23 family metallopeptidase [Deltaproteobacteria bacterium]|nr:MAG: M23 family metallopeptidase [Deltaproteobacteria bacterium]